MRQWEFGKVQEKALARDTGSGNSGEQQEW